MGNSSCQHCFEGLSRGRGSAPQEFKICITGGAGALGQQLCLLMAMEPRVKELSVYDMDGTTVPAVGVAADLSHLAAKCRVNSYTLPAESRPVRDLPKECLQGCSLVLISAGVPRRRGQEWVEWMRMNCNIAKLIVEACLRFCPPDAVLGLLVEPLGAVVPAMARLVEKRGRDPKQVLGITSLDSVRICKFVHEAIGEPAANIHVPVVGGHAGRSAVPLLSQDPVAARLPPERQQELETQLHGAGTKVVQAKQGKGSATLSAAYAASLFGKAVLQGLSGRRTSECAMVKSDVSELPYFASPVMFGRRGVERVPPLPRGLPPREVERLAEATKLLRVEVEAGLEYAKTNALMCDL